MLINLEISVDIYENNCDIFIIKVSLKGKGNRPELVMLSECQSYANDGIKVLMPKRSAGLLLTDFWKNSESK